MSTFYFSVYSLTDKDSKVLMGGLFYLLLYHGLFFHLQDSGGGCNNPEFISIQKQQEIT